MHALGVLAQARAGLVGADLLDAGAGGGREGGPRRYVVAEAHRRGALRCRRFIGGQAVATRRLRIVFPGHRHFAVEGERQLDQASGLAGLQLQLDLADRQPAVSGPNFAAIERYLDGRVVKLHRPNGAPELGREDRGQVCDNYVVIEEGSCRLVAEGRQFRHVVGHGTLDFLVGLQSAGIVDRQLQGLEALLADMADAQGPAERLQVEPGRVEIDA
jgi:hypothetical protein